MNIRPYTESDFPEISEIYATSKLDEFVNETNESQLIPLEKDHKSLAQLKESDIHVYEDESGKVRGYGAIYGSKIRMLFVHPDSRGRGLGKGILEYLLSKTSGQVTFFVVNSNTHAKGFV